MATEVLGAGNNVQVEEMANDVVAPRPPRSTGCATCPDRGGQPRGQDTQRQQRRNQQNVQGT